MGSLVVTFDQHPAVVISDTHIPLITTPQERRQLLYDCGVDAVVMLDFADIRHLTAREFMSLLHTRYQVNILLMGFNHRFGSDRLSAFDDYCREGKQVGVEVRLQDELSSETKVSSTNIRQLLLTGDIINANKLLGQPFIISGDVVHGRAIGREIGFPTANIQTDNPDKIIPPNGVYEAICHLADKSYRAILNIGNNPTVGGKERTIEAYLLDFEGDLYDQHLALSITRRIREERTFASLTELKQQIALDIQSIRG